VHGTGVPHDAFEPHVCTLLPEHWAFPGVQGPVHWPAWHDTLQATAAPQVPSTPQVCTPVPWHWVDPGAQMPVQLLATQA
jgi:hypothetical protein